MSRVTLSWTCFSILQFCLGHYAVHLSNVTQFHLTLCITFSFTTKVAAPSGHSSSSYTSFSLVSSALLSLFFPVPFPFPVFACSCVPVHCGFCVCIAHVFLFWCLDPTSVCCACLPLVFVFMGPSTHKIPWTVMTNHVIFSLFGMLQYPQTHLQKSTFEHQWNPWHRLASSAMWQNPCPNWQVPDFCHLALTMSLPDTVSLWDSAAS